MTAASATKPASIGMALLILFGGVGLGWGLLKTGPKVMPDEEVPVAKMVKVKDVQPDRYPIFVAAHGTVIPARQVTIEPEVSGLVIRQHDQLQPGKRIPAGAELFAIDPTLAQLTLEEALASVRRAEVNLEEANRQLAEAKQLADDALIPDSQLATLESAVRMQEAELGRLTASRKRREELLKRHRLVSPFNAIVLNEDVELGQRMDSGFSAATLIGSDAFWIQVSLPVDQIRHIRFPSPDRSGAQASVYVEFGDKKLFAGNGEVIGLRTDLEREGRMARLILSFPNPHAEASADRPQLFIGSYVRVDIEAGELEDCLAFHQSALRSGDKIWVVDQNQQLQIRDVELFWTMDDMVYVSNALQTGDSLIVSPLKSAVPGTPLNPQPDKAP